MEHTIITPPVPVPERNSSKQILASITDPAMSLAPARALSPGIPLSRSNNLALPGPVPAIQTRNYSTSIVVSAPTPISPNAPAPPLTPESTNTSTLQYITPNMFRQRSSSLPATPVDLLPKILSSPSLPTTGTPGPVDSASALLASSAEGASQLAERLLGSLRSIPWLGKDEDTGNDELVENSPTEEAPDTVEGLALFENTPGTLSLRSPRSSSMPSEPPSVMPRSSSPLPFENDDSSSPTDAGDDDEAHTTRGRPMIKSPKVMVSINSRSSSLSPERRSAGVAPRAVSPSPSLFAWAMGIGGSNDESDGDEEYTTPPPPGSAGSDGGRYDPFSFFSSLSLGRGSRSVSPSPSFSIFPAFGFGGASTGSGDGTSPPTTLVGSGSATSRPSSAASIRSSSTAGSAGSTTTPSTSQGAEAAPWGLNGLTSAFFDTARPVASKLGNGHPDIVEAGVVTTGDARKGFHMEEVEAIKGLMTERGLSFDDARLLHVHRKMLENGIDPATGMPVDDHRAVTFEKLRKSKGGTTARVRSLQ
ncbi:hypothetical protein HDU96_002447 [Phlyctochytrium bullatum]|nr:hypothetical protein HDU96_002447 [Phlyctochytrium bullatum]